MDERRISGFDKLEASNLFRFTGSSGNPTRPNRLQIFVKDKQWKSFYGTWHNIEPVQEGKWRQVTISPCMTHRQEVMLKPHVDVQGDSVWRGYIKPPTPLLAEWFQNYTKFMTHYARMAQRYNVGLFCIGTELASLDSNKTYQPFWNAVIDSIKKYYHGPLTYAANWDGYQSVRFWDRLDFAGIDAYFPLSDLRDSPLSALVDGWVSYTSYKPDAMRPALQVWSKYPWFKGMFWWTWLTYSDAGGLCNNDFTPQNRPAEVVLKKWYSQPVVVSEQNSERPPDTFTLSPNYPNPFNNTTVMHYPIPVHSQVTVQIYDMVGRLIRILTDQKQSAGIGSL